MTVPATCAPGAPARSPVPHVSAAGGWSDDAVETLKALWADGSLSAALIARRLGVTRNAVLGKIHRLGLSNRRARQRAQRPQRLPRPPRPARRSPPTRDPGPAGSPRTPQVLDTGPGLVARLEDIPAHGCHWPIGDPRHGDFAFCGRAARLAPYCDAHRAVAYQPGGPRPLTGLLKGRAT